MTATSGMMHQRPSDSAERAVERCRTTLALAFELEQARRLGEADVCVEFVEPGSGLGFGLVLEEDHPHIVGPDEPADIQVELGAEEFDALAAGELTLPFAILDGTVAYDGPVRHLLAVWPVLISCIRRAQDLDDVVPRATPNAARGEFAEGQPGEFWAVQCRDLHKRFARHEVLRGVDLAIPEGMITAVLGPSGTGKSVLIKHLTGLMKPDAGDVLVQGRNLAGMAAADLLELRRRYGLLFQDGALWGSMNIYDNVALPLRQHTDLGEREVEQVVRRHLEQVGLATAALRWPSELSGGMRKRAGFARALVLDPEIIIFDEPDTGLDPVRTALLCDLMREVHRELGGTYIVVTHDLGTIKRAADYIIVLWQGRVVEAGPADTVFASRNPFVKQFLRGLTSGPLGMD